MEPHPSQPVLDELLQQKAKRRRQLARLPIEEKFKIVTRLIELVQPVALRKPKDTL